ncbi:glucooligosaccharide oxidase [Armillaria nabsnona]|nr:glucooligosaccharide oxidase [Armillaria nabsnona]
MISAVGLVLAFFAALVFCQSALEHGLDDAGITAVFPGSSAYETASKPFNLRFDFSPVAVVYPSTVREVSTVVHLGQSEKLRVVARGGGHSYIANGLGGENGVLVIDLSNLTALQYDASSGIATIETGLRLGDVALALNDVGRGLPHGSCPYVGIGGHAAGGGFGFASRMWGLIMDRIVSMTVVLANGTITSASNDVNPDLFWALRGAASSFGIITSMKMSTLPAPSYAVIFSYNWQMRYEGAATSLVKFQEYAMTDIPAEFGAEVVLTKGGEAGNVTFAITGGFFGESEAALNKTFAPFLAVMPPPTNIRYTGNGTWISALEDLGGGVLDTHTAGPDGTNTFYAKSLMTPQDDLMTYKASEAFMKYLAYEGYTSDTSWFMQAELYGGGNSAINAIPVDSTSFATRSALFTIQFYAATFNNTPPYPDDGFAFLDRLVSNITTAMHPGWDYGAYVNYPDDRLRDWQHLYYKSHYRRLETMKKQYDPTGVFVFPIGIE